MFLVGTAPAEDLAARLGAPTITQWATTGLELRGVTVLQMVAELRRGGREAVLPPALHPTEPAALSIQAWRVADSDAGPFSFCHVRLSCRSGVRARGMTTAAVTDNETAAAILRDRFGYPCRHGEVALRTFYDRCELRVAEAGESIMAVTGIDPEPLGADDVQYTATLNLAYTPQGLRLVQSEAQHHTERVERVRGRIECFVPRAWGHERLDPYFVVTTTIATAESITIPAVRFVCSATESAFTGTEAIQR